MLTHPLEIQLPGEIEERLCEMTALEAGWLDGYGEAMLPGVVPRCRALLVRLALGGFPLERLVIGPHEDGTLLLQLSEPGHPTALVDVTAVDYDMTVFRDGGVVNRVYSEEQRGEMATNMHALLSDGNPW